MFCNILDLNENIPSKTDNDLGIFKNIKKVSVTGEHGDQKVGTDHIGT